MNHLNHFVAGTRRDWLRQALLGGSALPLLLGQAALAGDFPVGVLDIKGEAMLNDELVRPGTRVKPGDRLETATASSAVVVIGKDAFLLREKTQLLTAGSQSVVNALRLVQGKLLSVFGHGPKRLFTPTATIGIRGTGIYIEVETERTYVCTCYGQVELQASNMPQAREIVNTTHHDAPRYIYAHGEMPIKMIEVAPVINHTDAELILLEALLGREPPFVGLNQSDQYGK